MTGQGLGGANRRGCAFAKDGLDRTQLGHVAHGGRGAVCVDVLHVRCLDRPVVEARQRLAHTADRAFARGGHHVVTVGGCAIADDFGVNLRPARLGPLVFFEHQHRTARRNDKAVAVLVKGARGLFRGLVVLGAHGPHGVKAHGQGPVLFLTTTGKNHVLLAELDQLSGVTDTVRGGRTGRGDGIVVAVNLEQGREHRRTGRGHNLGHVERADALHAFFRCRFHGVGLPLHRRPARTDDQPDAIVFGVVGFFQTGVRQRFLHGNIGVARRRAHEAEGAAVDVVFQLSLDRAGNLGPKAALNIIGLQHDAGGGVAEGLSDSFFADPNA